MFLCRVMLLTAETIMSEIARLSDVLSDLADTMRRLEELEESFVDVDEAPEPGEPKVVGFLTEDYREHQSSVRRMPDDRHHVPVILLSDHEAVVRGLRERLHSVAELSGDRKAEITRLKAENERLTKYRDDREKQVRGEAIASGGFAPDDADYLRILVSYGRQAVTAPWLCALADKIDATLAERDAYADPENWQAKYTDPETGRSVLSKFFGVPLEPTYVGPTPSDSTERESEPDAHQVFEAVMSGHEDTVSVDDYARAVRELYPKAHPDTRPDGVKGEVMAFEFHTEAPRTEGSVEYAIEVRGRHDVMEEGTPVRITRIPTPGGSDGES